MTEPQKIAHLLRRFGLGASESELDYYGSGGLAGAIDRLLNYERIEDNWTFDPAIIRNDQGNIPMPIMQAWWYARVLTTNRPLQERMTMFWHDHFATSAAKVNAAPAMDQHIQVLRRNALGKFGALLEDVSKDPAMLFWLDNQLNVKGRPNENFAREVMELFTLGIGHYTETDVQEAARAFTGWRFGRRAPNGAVRQTPQLRGQVEFVFDPFQHDDGEKVVLGRRGSFNGDDVLRLLADQTQTARNIVKKMWEWFAYPNPELGLMERLTARFRQTGLDIKDLVRAIMESPEFYSPRAEIGVVKDPVVFCVSTARALGLNNFQLQVLGQASTQPADVPQNQRARPVLLGGLLMQSTRSMGMALMMPPDVAGWEIGQGWISSATMVERMKWADRLFNPAGRGGQPARPRGTLGANAQQDGYYFSIVGQASDPKECVARVLSLYGLDGLRGPKLEALNKGAQDASGGLVTAQNVRQVLITVSRAIFGMPEFQIA